MPRTAPVPNIPAIPGMNPGAWVKGGGAGGGGGSGNGKGSGNGQGANGNNGGDGADGDGRGGNGCGQGTGGGCNNPAHGGSGGTAAGDPVDVTSGRVFTTPVVDLALPGPLLLVLRRQYSSKAIDRDVGLGAGWSHSLAWEIVVRRRTLIVYRPDGTRAVWATPAVGSVLDLGDGDRLRRDRASFSLTARLGPRASVHARVGRRVALGAAGVARPARQPHRPFVHGRQARRARR